MKVSGNQSTVRIGGVYLECFVNLQSVYTTGAGSHRVATYGSDRVSSLVEYKRRLNSWYGEGQHKSIDTRVRNGSRTINNMPFYVRVAKLVRPQTDNLEIVGSSPTPCTIVHRAPRDTPLRTAHRVIPFFSVIPSRISSHLELMSMIVAPKSKSEDTPAG